MLVLAGILGAPRLNVACLLRLSETLRLFLAGEKLGLSETLLLFLAGEKLGLSETLLLFLAGEKLGLSETLLLFLAGEKQETRNLSVFQNFLGRPNAVRLYGPARPDSPQGGDTLLSRVLAWNGSPHLVREAGAWELQNFLSILECEFG
ncbi:hypothetical protein RRG08_025612 [Elysia crispata]|uniref:Uncharacterized protein n=1 Tax=Elysia crispata TaxID=231223 RepID=A0AAE0YE26_9GAST|nr:hypothetical protein RRG08_025612 [Elysia crispata]